MDGKGESEPPNARANKMGRRRYFWYIPAGVIVSIILFVESLGYYINIQERALAKAGIDTFTITDKEAQRLKEKNNSLAEQSRIPEAKKLIIANRIIIAFLITFLLVLAFVLNISQMSNNDIWMHLKNGELILKGRRFLYTDTYSFRTIGKPWVNHEWLAGVIFYLIYQVGLFIPAIGPVNAVIFLKAFMVVALTIFMVATCRLTKNRWTILCLPVFYNLDGFARHLLSGKQPAF